jgi:phosphohistidine phosphatase
MHLLLIRHADAGDRDPALWPDDTLRPVSDRGRRQHRRVARRLRRRGLRPTLHLSSPWLRAWQSAQLIAEHARAAAPVGCPALAAAPELRALARAIGPQPPEAVVALVGHEPWLSELAALLLTGQTDGLRLDFPKSGVVGLETDGLEAGGARLSFFWRR